MALTRILMLGGVASVASAAFAYLPKTDLSVLGSVYQPAANESFEAFDNAKQTVLDALRDIIASGNSTYGPFDNATTSFSASVFSLKTGKSIFEYHFEAPQLNGSYTKGKLTENTIYRTGSLGKLMTIYTWLVDIGDSIYTDSITKYIPELAEAQNTYENALLSTNWSEVTIGSLASQLSGIGRDFHLGDLAISSFQSPPASAAIQNGYPPLVNETVPQCDSYGNELPTCTRQQFLDGMINLPPVFSPYYSPSYSNLAYALLGLAYENITGRSMADGQMNVLNQKLGMASTTPLAPGNGADAIIPRNDSFAIFSYDIGIQGPAGNQYTTTKDLRTWGQAIYTCKLLSPVVTGRWMKPTSFTSQWEAAVGAPWEIYRIALPVNTLVNASRIVDTYSKSGDIGLYSTYFGLVPDYELGISVLTAGEKPGTQVPPVRGTLVDAYYNAAEAAAKEQARAAFSGIFRSHDRNSSITLTVDGGTGVKVQSWISNSTDFLANQFYGNYGDFRLYPSTLTFQSGDLTYYKYHLNTYVKPNGEPFSGDPWALYNDYWVQLDGYHYNTLATDAFVIGMNSDGMVMTVESQALRSTMYRA